MKFKIRLENTQDAEEFVSAASKCGGDIDLHSGVVYIDGSIDQGQAAYPPQEHH